MPSTLTQSTASSPLLQLTNISKQYSQGQQRLDVLRQLELTLHSGEFVALCGPSGSGKSTLLNICGLIDSADSGELYWQQQRLSRNQRALTLLRREQLGFVFQAFNLVPVMTAAQNVELPLLLGTLGAKQRRARVSRLLEQVGLSPFANQKPDQLSGGQRQRVAIARALIKQPRLVIADEPTANLDSDTAEQVVKLMRQQAHQTGTTFLIATHDARMTRHCDRILHLEHGQLSEEKAKEKEKAREQAA